MYRARNTGLGCNVATKVPSDTLARDTDRLRRFEQEARTTATLNHSDILAIHEIGTPDRRDFWLASFWKVRRRARNWGPFDVRSGCYERLEMCIRDSRPRDQGHGHSSLYSSRRAMTPVW